ncbi:hypothetical protein HIN51_23120, partial [Salmonella enterica subsp. enterica serovar Dublin]|nr:hypothetical protein [Salmonella enterica subsp. enterica serovar Dublin]
HSVHTAGFRNQRNRAALGVKTCGNVALQQRRDLRGTGKHHAAREGAIVSVQGFARGESNILLERLYIERSLSVNTAAAGGNASLMTIG